MDLQWKDGQSLDKKKQAGGGGYINLQKISILVARILKEKCVQVARTFHIYINQIPQRRISNLD